MRWWSFHIYWPVVVFVVTGVVCCGLGCWPYFVCQSCACSGSFWCCCCCCSFFVLLYFLVKFTSLYTYKPSPITIPPPPPPPPPLPCIATPMVWSVDKVSIFTTIQVRTCRKCLLMRCPWTSLTMARTPHRQQQLQRMERQWGRYELRCTKSHSKGCVPVTM